MVWEGRSWILQLVDQAFHVSLDCIARRGIAGAQLRHVSPVVRLVARPAWAGAEGVPKSTMGDPSPSRDRPDGLSLAEWPVHRQKRRLSELRLFRAGGKPLQGGDRAQRGLACRGVEKIGAFNVVEAAARPRPRRRAPRFHCEPTRNPREEPHYWGALTLSSSSGRRRSVEDAATSSHGHSTAESEADEREGATPWSTGSSSSWDFRKPHRANESRTSSGSRRDTRCAREIIATSST